MTVAEMLTHKVSQLPMNRQLEVLDFVEFIERKQGQPTSYRDPEGLLADQAASLSLEDFTAARREAWGNSPRERATSTPAGSLASQMLGDARPILPSPPPTR